VNGATVSETTVSSPILTTHKYSFWFSKSAIDEIFTVDHANILGMILFAGNLLDALVCVQ
jgi:hypothetical protein